MLAYDSDNVDDIPADAPIVNYYDDGEPGTASAAQLTRFATPFKYSITRKQGVPGYWGDCEPGCLWPVSVAAVMWLNGLVKGLYVGESNWADLRAAVASLGVPKPPYWVAAYPNTLPVGPVVPQSWIALGCVMWQYADPPLSGGHYDLSVTAPGFPPVPVPPPNGDQMTVEYKDYVGPDNRRRISGPVDVAPGQVAIAVWVETAPGSNQFEWFDLNGITVNTGTPPAPHYISTS